LAPHRIDWNLARSTIKMSMIVLRQRDTALSVMGISWFFAVGLVEQTQLAPLTNGVLHATKDVVALLLIVNAVGIALGSLLIGILLKGRITSRYVPLLALLMAAGALDLWLATRQFAAPALPLDTIGFLSIASAWHVIFAVFALAVAGGMFIVPLYAILQTRSGNATCAEGIASNNIMNGLVMVVLAQLSGAMVGWGLTIPQILGALGVETITLTLIAFGPTLVDSKADKALQI
ncbi:MAG: acyl-[ACP]--phospholipid O-acyltransferase, partial [Alphaproteobacteria bacterium]|nr:acyl-[ACP]--phospholipid O-acyltransferase [Alphaproteobacteria bacterium]